MFFRGLEREVALQQLTLGSTMNMQLQGFSAQILTRGFLWPVYTIAFTSVFLFPPMSSCSHLAQ